MINGAVKTAGNAISSWLEEKAAKQSLIGDSVFFSKAHFPWTEELEANRQTIRQECDQVMGRKFP
ncbi:hypothetical protein [Leptolyngbya sp. FACHB-711]|uniref:hypothetical protein n=1 Tax=unclassified Leptolyngbya TaxID=2650499 RepID=UPI0016860181|nr:hypothetical protein [Leptolyngbya sp. FACHB-711]MBD1851040.1 hypothetical protein [Cyanobacteria bacterium FACHB-502]MBD2026873.1 hypothetical protein [Leptolyngbya sp. FACHB-711]